MIFAEYVYYCKCYVIYYEPPGSARGADKYSVPTLYPGVSFVKQTPERFCKNIYLLIIIYNFVSSSAHGRDAGASSGRGMHYAVAGLGKIIKL